MWPAPDSVDPMLGVLSESEVEDRSTTAVQSRVEGRGCATGVQAGDDHGASRARFGRACDCVARLGAGTSCRSRPRIPRCETAKARVRRDHAIKA